MAGSYAVKKRFCEAVGLDPHGEHHGFGEAPPTTSKDGKFSVEFVECLASCGTAPGRAHQRRPSRKHLCREGRRHFGTVSMSVKRFVMPAPHPKERRIIFENIAKPGYDGDIDAFLANGGYESLRKAVTMKPGEIVDAVKASNLRGRGGAGLPVRG